MKIWATLRNNLVAVASHPYIPAWSIYRRLVLSFLTLIFLLGLILRDLAVLIGDQGGMLDDIEAGVMNTAEHTETAKRCCNHSSQMIPPLAPVLFPPISISSGVFVWVASYLSCTGEGTTTATRARYITPGVGDNELILLYFPRFSAAS